MHAINAYFGHAKLDRAAFESAIAEYDTRQMWRNGLDVSARDYDIVTSDQRSVIAHILAKSGVFARIYESLPEDRSRAIAKAETYGVAFVYTPDHIWLIRRADSSADWFKVDSLSGVSPFNINELTRNPTLGMIIPTTNLKAEFDDIAADLNSLVMPDIVDYLITTFNSKKVLGRAETLIGSACTLLELQNNGRVTYTKVIELLKWYDEFMRTFTGSNCGSLRFILRTVPQIIARIIVIWMCGSHINPS